jgi:Fe-S cluster assembly protein SufD
MSVQTMTLHEKLQMDFSLFEQQLNGQSKSSVHQIRKAAMERFTSLGFPTIRHEEWKYTNVMPLVAHEFHVLASSAHTTSADIQHALIPGFIGSVVVIVNGLFRADLSHIHTESGVSILSFADAVAQRQTAIEHFGRYASFEKESMLALNTAFSRDGVVIHVERNTIAQHPLHIMYVNDTRSGNVMSNPRVLALIEDNAQFTMAETFHTIGSGQSWINLGFEAGIAPNAVLKHDRVQDESDLSVTTSTHIMQARDSNYHSVSVSLAGRIIRNNLNTTLNGKGCHADFIGLYMPSGKTLVDNHTVVDHAVAHCTSNELYKGILDERGIGVFNGKIFVRKDAQKTQAYQSNRNILLSNTATINTKPQLEIFADDVKCSHGATSGQLDETSLFYLRARGIGKERAKALLLYAFAEEVVEHCALPAVQQYIEHRIADILHQEQELPADQE